MPEPVGPDSLDMSRVARRAGVRALDAADRALESDDAAAGSAAYLEAAAHFRKAAECAAAAGDEGARRTDERAAVDALYAALPIFDRPASPG